LFVQLSKAEADRKRTAATVKRKAELALEEMEEELMEAIKHHPDLRLPCTSFSSGQGNRFLTEGGNLDTGT